MHDRRSFLRAAGSVALVPFLGAAPEVAAPGRARAAQSTSARLRQLARATKGPLTRPSNSSQIVFNSRFARTRPLAWLRAANANDVAEAVQWAARNEIPIVARSGGHSYAGYSTRSEGLVVDLRNLDGISVSSGSGTATVQGGAELIDVYAALANRGVTIPAGTCPSVGISGLTLGGGVGMASRKLGTTSDNVVALKIVTADGQLKTATATQNPDLFWACRGGGGGNFGIVTQWTFDVTRVSSASYFNVSWPASQATAGLAAWQGFVPEATDDLFGICSLTGGSASAFGQYFGSASSLRSLLRPLTRVSGASLTVGSGSYLNVMKRWAGCTGESIAACARFAPQPFTGASDYVAKPLSSAGRAAAVRASRGGVTLICDSYGGAINEVAADATAFAHRDQLFSIQYYAGGDAEGAVARARKTMSPYVSGAAYVNYLDPDLRGFLKAYYGSNLTRLEEIKAAVDPDQVFRFPQGIPG